jgi:phosphoglycolate phosphatase-like HAD superfamily hydrolase
MDLRNYKTWLFDCDGVLLDSNKLKSEAFFEIALPYGIEKAEALVEFNKEFGGVTRFEKFKYFFKDILCAKEFEYELANALSNFGDLVCKKLMDCQETSGLRNFMESLPENSNKFVVSGGLQSEIKYVFEKRGLDVFFNGIYGSPDSKIAIMRKMSELTDIQFPAVFLGDSRYDYEAASQFGLDFVFMTKYSEFLGWEEFFMDKDVVIIESLNELYKISNLKE